MPLDVLYDLWAFDQLEPIGGRATDERLAYQLATMANLAGGKGRDHRPYQLSDFLLQRAPQERTRKREEPRMSPEESTRHILQVFKAISVGLPRQAPEA